MEYLILIYGEPFEAPAPGTPEFEQMMATWAEYNQRLIDGGHWVSAANLAPVGCQRAAATLAQAVRWEREASSAAAARRAPVAR